MFSYLGILGGTAGGGGGGGGPVAIGDVTGLQAALDGKAASSHTHAIGDVTGLQAALDGKAASSHTHAQSDITNLTTDLAAKAPLTAAVNAQTGTSYSLVAGDNGKVVTLTNAAAITLTIPTGLGEGFNCLVIQGGAGQVTFSPSSTTLRHRQSHNKTAGQWATATLVAIVANELVLGGDTTS